MLILALDSTAVVASVALCRDEQVLASFTVKNGNTHSQTLLPMVEAVLKSCEVSIPDVDLFACSTGPGSFTGVRIGTATVKGLAFGQNKPCVGVSTLEALAENLVPFEGVICPVMNARRGQVYNALFTVENGALVRLCDNRAISVEDLEKELIEMDRPFMLCGDGESEFLRLAKETSPVAHPDLLGDQNAVCVAKVALKRQKTGESVTDAELKPTYLRLPQAERERLARLEQNAPV